MAPNLKPNSTICSICSSLFPSWHIGAEQLMKPVGFDVAYHFVVYSWWLLSFSERQASIMYYKWIEVEENGSSDPSAHPYNGSTVKLNRQHQNVWVQMANRDWWTDVNGICRWENALQNFITHKSSIDISVSRRLHSNSNFGADPLHQPAAISISCSI